MPKPTFRKKSVDNDNSISKFSDEKISVGDIRKTQVITTFGVGSIVGNDEFSMSIRQCADATASFLVFEEGKGKVDEHTYVLN